VKEYRRVEAIGRRRGIARIQRVVECKDGNDLGGIPIEKKSATDEE